MLSIGKRWLYWYGTNFVSYSNSLIFVFMLNMPSKYIYCLEAVADIDHPTESDVLQNLGQLAIQHGIDSIYETCDTIEGLDESLNKLLYDDHNFTNYEIIYLVMAGDGNNICINDYFYSISEMAEIFEGKMTNKIIHFANVKQLGLSQDEAQFFLEVTGARAVSGYGRANDEMTSGKLDNLFFAISQEHDDVTDVVEELFAKHYSQCTMLDFKMWV